MNQEIKELLHAIYRAIDSNMFEQAESHRRTLKVLLDADVPRVVRLPGDSRIAKVVSFYTGLREIARKNGYTLEEVGGAYVAKSKDWTRCFFSLDAVDGYFIGFSDCDKVKKGRG